MKTKKLLSLLLFLLITFSAFPQGYNCAWVTPLPQGNTLNSAWFFNANTGFVVGEFGTILKTTDAGKSWTIVESKTTENLQKVAFIDDKNGFIIGQKGALLLTYNGGASWMVKSLNTYSKLVDMHFVNSTTGFILTERTDLFKTDDGGRNWSKIQLPTREQLRAMDFSNLNNGVIIANRNDLLRSTDGGNTWSVISLKTSTNPVIKSSYFSDIQTFDNTIVLCSKKNLFFSTDYGKNWITQEANSKSGYIESMNFVNNRMAFLADAYGNLLKSFNGVKQYQFKLEHAQKTKLNDIFMVSTTTGYAVGVAGRVFGTIDGGENWKLLTIGSTENYKDIQYVNPGVGYILTDAGKLYKTMDEGKSLILVKEKIMGGFTNAFNDIHFLDQNVGFASTSMGNLYTTQNGGTSWTSMRIKEGKLSRFEFIDKNTGYIGSKNGIIYKTSNRGTSWTPINTGVNTTIYDISFANANVGYAACDKGIALKTVDGGKTWTQIQTVLKNNLLVVKAINSNTVMFSTSGNYTKMADAPIIRSADGGASWKTITIPPYSVYKFDFFNNMIGAALCSGGVLATTTDGGQTWYSNQSITNEILWGIHWKSVNEMLTVGTSGAIIKYGKGQIAADKTDDIKKDDNKEDKKDDVVVKTPDLKRTLNGVPIEFSSIKKVKNTKIGVLKKETAIKVGSNIIPVAAGTTVNYDSAKAIITRAQVKVDTRASVKGGAILIKGGTFVDLAEGHIMNAVIKEDVVITNETGAIPVKALPTGDKPNIVFTNKGDLSYAYLSDNFSAQLDEQTISFPVGSRLDFSYGKISGANLSQNVKINLSGKEYELEGNSGASVKSFSCSASSGELSSIRVTNGHTIYVNDMDMPVKGSSYIILTKKSGNYEIRKFDIGKAMTIDIYKKKKVKQKDVKYGKTLVVEDGKIIRTAL